MKILKTPLEGDVEVIYHLADIHIRNDPSRHDEYIAVFDRLFALLEKEKRKAVTIVCGDIVHNKTVLRPDCIDLVKYFYVGLAKHTDVISIIGNHDCNINNQDALDSLTPIISKNFRTKNKIFLLKNDKEYRYRNLVLGLTTIYAKKVTPSATPLKRNWKRIGLYHGTLKGAKIDSDYQITNDRMFTNSNFEDYDLTLLGDIHKHQYMDAAKTIAYSGSLIQQNHGESVAGHGCLIWNLADNSSKFHEIFNEHGYVTANLDEEGLHLPDRIPDIPHFRLIHKKVKSQVVVNAEMDIKRRFENATLVTYKDVNEIDIDLNFGDEKEDEKFAINEIKNLDVVKRIIKNYLLTKKKLEESVVNDMLLQVEKLQEEVNYDYDFDVRQLNLDLLTFSNLFSYGEENEIDFSKFRKVVGIVAKNGAGKSSIIDSILYTIYGKYSRGERFNAVNIHKTTAESRIKLKINGASFEVERTVRTTASRRRNSYALKFSRNGKLITDDEKTLTGAQIEKHICRYDDLVNTSIILQNGNNFLDLDTNRKKEYICRLLNLDIFELLMKKARFYVNSLRQTILRFKQDHEKYDRVEVEKLLKETNSEIKELNKDIKASNKIIDKKQKRLINLNTKIGEMTGGGGMWWSPNELATWRARRDELRETLLGTEYREIDSMKSEVNPLRNKMDDDILDEYEDRQQTHRKLRNRWDKRRTELIKKQQGILSRYLPVDKELLNNYATLEQELRRCVRRIACHTDMLEKYQRMANNWSVPSPDTEAIGTGFTQMKDTIRRISRRVLELNEEKEGLADRLDGLKNHRWNPDCDACMSNRATTDKILWTERLDDVTNELRITKQRRKLHRRYVEILSPFNEWTESYENETDDNTPNDLIDSTQGEMRELEAEKDRLSTRLRGLEIHRRNESANRKLDAEIAAIKEELEDEFEDTEYDKYMTSWKKQQDLKKKLDKMEKTIASYDKLHREFTELDEKVSRAETSSVEDLQADVEKTEKIMKKHRKKVDGLQKEVTTLSERRVKCKYQLKTIKETEGKIAELEREKDRNDKIARLLDKDGLIDYLLNVTVLPNVQRVVNNILSFIADFRVSISYDRSGINIYKDSNGKLLNSMALCGFERFITNIAFRLAFNRINGRIKTDFLIIDEGFSCCDEENVGRLKALFEFIRKNYRWCLVITHLDEIKNNFDSIISIDRRPSGSKIRA